MFKYLFNILIIIVLFEIQLVMESYFI